ncbi:MAG: hypothetical protein ETSY2_46435 [Candidatus Entotheonella gemina]|uniref:Polymerase nucleotidyl transferase domain-containing protein n=1 Tax=Candidatus Entotheonella gemina TaxID=1429439 RepID=W4LFD8_9BACT|nr:MAG: hypothetical protein ETSY2_46435 [Candidatus Entotheonella gemina]
MIPPFDSDGHLPPGLHLSDWIEFHERFCIFTHSDCRLQLCHQIERMIEEARASNIVERLIFGGSFVTSKSEPNDFDCVIVLSPGIDYERLQPFQRWVADTREASRRYRGDVFVARANQETLSIYLDFFARNRDGKQVGLIEVTI